MSQEHFQRQMDFIIEQQARFSADIGQLKEVQKQQTANLDRLTSDVQALTESVAVMRSEMEANREEAREAFNNLIIANEVTRNLAENVAKLAMATSQRVTALESRQDGE